MSVSLDTDAPDAPDDPGAAFLAGLSAVPMAYGGHPGMAVLTQPLPYEIEGERHVLMGVLLVQAPEGAAGHYLTSESDDPDAWPGGMLRPLYLAYGWTDGSAAVDALRARGLLGGAFDHALRERIRERIAELVAAAMPEAGFSDAFREGLRIASWFGRPPFNAHADALFRPDLVGDRIRALAAAHPFATLLGWHRAIACAEAGDASADAAFPELSPARLARLSGPGWEPSALAATHGVADNQDRPGEARDLLAFLGAVPVDWIPRDGDDARHLVGCFRLARAASKPTGRSILDLLGSSKGDWASAWSRVMPDHLVGRDAARFAGYLADAANDISRSLVVPALLRTGIEEMHPGHVIAIAAELVYGGKSLPACLETSERWHRHHHRIEAMRPDGHDPEKPWDRAIPDWTVTLPVEGRPETFRVVYLNSRRGLLDEGEAGPDANGAAGLDHCVASYRADARAGKCHIVSVRRDLPGGGYERLATVEIKPAHGSGWILWDQQVLLGQVSGTRNAKPPADVESVVGLWMRKRWRRHGRRMALAWLRHWWSGPGQLGDHAAAMCGYDWQDAGQFAQAVSAYAFLLPRDLRDPASFEARVAALAVGRGAVRSAPRDLGTLRLAQPMPRGAR